MDPEAFRNGVWPDVSCGPFQQTVLYATGYGVGDGTDSPENVAVCRAYFADWGHATEIAAQQLATDYAGAKGHPEWYATADDIDLGALSRYNSGSYNIPGSAWWNGGNAASYRYALDWARGVLETS